MNRVRTVVDRNLQVEAPGRTVVPYEPEEPLLVAMPVEHAASGTRNQWQDDVLERPIEDVARSGESRLIRGAVRPGIASAEEQRQDFTIGRIGEVFRLVRRHVRRSRLPPFAVLAPLPEQDVEDGAEPIQRVVDVNRINELAVGEPGRGLRSLGCNHIALEFLKKTFPHRPRRGMSGASLPWTGDALVGWRPILRFERGVWQDWTIAREQFAPIGFEQRCPNVFADLSAVRVIGALAGRGKPIRSTFASELDAIITRAADNGVRAPFPPGDLNDGAGSEVVGAFCARTSADSSNERVDEHRMPSPPV